MAFTTSGQETEWALFLQPRSPHGAKSPSSSYLCFNSLLYVQQGERMQLVLQGPSCGGLTTSMPMGSRNLSQWCPMKALKTAENEFFYKTDAVLDTQQQSNYHFVLKYVLKYFSHFILAF